MLERLVEIGLRGTVVVDDKYGRHQHPVPVFCGIMNLDEEKEPLQLARLHV